MSDPHQTDSEGTIPCEVCMKEVPASEAKIEEASDYVRYFCGLECYKKWREKSEQEQKD